MPCINTPGANKGAFAAIHAFSQFRADRFGFTAPDHKQNMAEADWFKLACGAGSSAGTARHAYPRRWFFFLQPLCQGPVVVVQVDGVIGM